MAFADAFARSMAAQSGALATGAGVVGRAQQLGLARQQLGLQERRVALEELLGQQRLDLQSQDIGSLVEARQQQTQALRERQELQQKFIDTFIAPILERDEAFEAGRREGATEAAVTGAIGGTGAALGTSPVAAAAAGGAPLPTASPLDVAQGALAALGVSNTQRALPLVGKLAGLIGGASGEVDRRGLARALTGAFVSGDDARLRSLAQPPQASGRFGIGGIGNSAAASDLLSRLLGLRSPDQILPGTPPDLAAVLP